MTRARTGRFVRTAHVAAALIVASGAALAGCDTTWGPAGLGGGSSCDLQRLTQSAVTKLDLLLALDNSRSMADKQQILNLAVPDLVNRLVNPNCINPDTKVPVSSGQPTSPNDPCPAGAVREFQAVLDMHIGIVDSSLGGHGSDACPDSVPSSPDCGGTATNTSNNDYGRLITRNDPCKPDQAATYQNLGFLAWDASGLDLPPGEKDGAKLMGSLTELVSGTGQIGCGFPSQNEAWYRFLVDPNPYASIALVGGKAVMAGTDHVLLKQRSDFLRPSSMLAVIVLTDENDCSVREGGQYYVATQLSTSNGPYHLPPARSECAQNPSDPCCKSCGQPVGSCPADPNCSTPLDSVTDNVNLRCFDNKRRFGIDFLYPWQRYVNALTQFSINPGSGDLALNGGAGQPNPIFSDLQPNDGDTSIRTPDLVFMAGIVGVPWQDIARLNTSKVPDLLQGRDAKGDTVGGFQSASELQTNGIWDLILGDPDTYKLPTDPHMHEQIGPRTTGDKNPITGDAIAPPTAPNGTDPISGHEYTISDGGDLQYACIFDLPFAAARDCSKGQSACDCADPTNDKPLCEPNPADAMKRTLQTRAKAYPGIRHLQILKGLDGQGIVASICPEQVNDINRADFGYRPAVGAIVDRLKTKLGGQCLPRTLTPDAEGHVPCLIIEARKSGGACTCDTSLGRSPVAAEHQQAVIAAQEDPLYATQHWDCFCEIDQTSGTDLNACQNDLSGAPVVKGHAVNGWCYIDDTTAPPTGNPKLVENCPSTEKRLLRFVGAGKGAPGATEFITCCQ